MNNCKYRFDRNAVDHWEDRRDSRYLLWNGIDRGRCVYRYGLYFSAGALSEKTKSIIFLHTRGISYENEKKSDLEL